MEGVLFEFYRGDTYSRDFVITGYSLPISKVYFTVKENVEDKKAILQKTLNNGIILVEESEDTKAYNLLINSTDTDDMKADYNYVFDIEIHSPGAVNEPIKKTIITGTLKLKASSTSTYNES